MRCFLQPFFFGKDFVKSHVDTLIGEGKSLISRSAGNEYELRRIKNLIEDVSLKVFELRDTVDDLNNKAEALKSEIKTISLDTESHITDLRLERDFLQSSQEILEVGGKKYSRERVLFSAEARINLIESNQRIINIKKNSLSLLEAAILEGGSNLEKAKTIRVEYLAKLNQLETQMQIALNNKAIYEMVQPIIGDSFAVEATELTESFQNYQKRINEVERNNKIFSTTRDDSKILNHSTDDNSFLMNRLNNLFSSNLKTNLTSISKSIDLSGKN